MELNGTMGRVIIWNYFNLQQVSTVFKWTTCDMGTDNIRFGISLCNNLVIPINQK